MIRLLFLLFALIIINACSSTEQTTQDQSKNEKEVYVFDDVNKIDSTKQPLNNVQKQISKTDTVVIPIQTIPKGGYTVQVGAFSTKERAELFLNENQGKTSIKMNITYNELKKLFVIQTEFYRTKEEADSVRDNFRKIASFKDAFTVTVEK